MHLFRSSSVPRAILIGALFWLFAGFGSVLFRLVGFRHVGAVLPFSAYANRVERFSGASITCYIPPATASVRCRSSAAEEVGVRGNLKRLDLHHAYYYYLRRLGPWEHPPMRRQTICAGVSKTGPAKPGADVDRTLPLARRRTVDRSLRNRRERPGPP